MRMVAIREIEPRKNRRFLFEFFIIAFIVALGAVRSYEIGLYRFRIADLVLMLGSFYFTVAVLRGRVERKVVVLFSFYAVYIVSRVINELSGDLSVKQTRTLFGMAAIYLAPPVFFVVRESGVSRKVLVYLVVLS